MTLACDQIYFNNFGNVHRVARLNDGGSLLLFSLFFLRVGNGLEQGNGMVGLTFAQIVMEVGGCTTGCWAVPAWNHFR